MCIIVLTLGTIGGGVVAGIIIGRNDIWPTLVVNNIAHRIAHSTIGYDRYGRLIAFPGKQQVACPSQNGRTAVLLAVGQSNAANHQGQRYSGIDGSVVNFFAGRCYAAGSPLLGASGEWGETWTLLANNLVRAGAFDRVVIISTGIGSTAIHQWTPAGDLGPLLRDVVSEASSQYIITHVLWHQGETDYVRRTPPSAYAADFIAIKAALRHIGVSAPVYLCRASYVPGRNWQLDNPVRQAQTHLIEAAEALPGPDSDALVPEIDRYDRLHFSANGQERVAAEWLRYLGAIFHPEAATNETVRSLK